MTKPNKKIITNDDLISQLPKERQDKINAEVEANIKKWGGARENSGRPLKTAKVLKFTRRLSEDESRLIDYVRENHITCDDLMQG